MKTRKGGKQMRKLGLILLALALGMLALGAGAESAAAPVETPAAPAPMDSVIGAFSTVDLMGNPVDSNVFASGKLTLVNVWATFCSPCVEEIPYLAKLDKEIEGFQVLGVLGDAGSKDAADSANLELGKEILEKSGAAYASVLPDETLNTMLMPYITAYPTSFFVDQNGQIVGKAIVGSMGYDDWKMVIEEKMAAVEAG